MQRLEVSGAVKNGRSLPSAPHLCRLGVDSETYTFFFLRENGDVLKPCNKQHSQFLKNALF